MRLFYVCFFIIRLVFSRKCGWFIRWCHWFGWYLPCSWIRWVIRQCFKWVIWGQAFIRNYNSILCHTDTLFFPHCIIMTECVLQFFLSLVYDLHHIRKLWMLIFVRLKLTSQVTIGFFSSYPLLKTDSNQEHDNAIHFPTFPESIEQLVEQIFCSIPVWRLSDWECVLHIYLFLAELLE